MPFRSLRSFPRKRGSSFRIPACAGSAERACPALHHDNGDDQSPITPKAAMPAWLRGLGGLIGFALLLEIVPRIGLVSPHYLPPFSEIMVALARELATANFWHAFGDTMRAWALGLVISLAAGTVIGIVIGSSNLLRTLSYSTIEFLRPIPSVRADPAGRAAVRHAARCRH